MDYVLTSYALSTERKNGQWSILTVRQVGIGHGKEISMDVV